MRSGEFEWISRYLAPLAGEGAFGLKDDAALLAVPDGQQLVVTQDALFENLHFLPDDPLDTVAQKAMRVNISDLVAKGATAFAWSLSLGLPDNWRDADMALFCQGLAADQAQYGLKLTGGDTCRSADHLSLSITMFGGVSQGRYVSRLGARAGDVVAVSGTIGNAAAGLLVEKGKLQVPEKDRVFFTNAFRLPDPPVALAPLIAEFANASMDISDGLLGDFRKLCMASGVDGELDRSAVPLSGPLQNLLHDQPDQHAIIRTAILAGGDDYQCLMSVPPPHWQEFQQAAARVGQNITAIGKICKKGSGNIALHDKGMPLSVAIESYTHF